MNKIVICGLIHDLNLGEHIIFETVQYLFKKKLAKSDYIVQADLFGRVKSRVLWNKKDDPFNMIRNNTINVLKKVFSFFNKDISNILSYIEWSISPNGKKRLIKYFRSIFKEASLIIIDGGGIIECEVHQYQLPLEAIVKVAREMNIPVIFNAVGLVGIYNEKDFRYKLMKKVLNDDIVKHISVRDDIDTMNNLYLKTNGKKAILAADSAVWVSEAFKINKNVNADTIGLGMIRSNIYDDYNLGMSEYDLINIWTSIIKELEKRNYKWKIFCNGFYKDNELGEKILDKLNITDKEKYICNVPNSAYELAEMISNFKAIICHRLHACITAYSLDIPAIALSWNKKLGYFYKYIGFPERVLEPNKFDPVIIVDCMEKSIIEGYRDEFTSPNEENHRLKYRETINNSISQALKIVINETNEI